MNFNNDQLNRAMPRGRSIVAAGVLLLCIGALILAVFKRDRTLPNEVVQQRSERLKALSRFEKEHLSRQQRRFARLDTESQTKLRSLQSKIDADADAERLKQVMSRYGGWLAGLPSTQRAELLSLPPAQRLQQVAALLKKEHEDRFAELLQVKLEDKDLQVILKWWDNYVEHSDKWVSTNLPSVLATLTDDQRSRYHRSDDPKRCRRGLIVGAFLAPSRYKKLPADFPRPTESDFQVLGPQLSDRGSKLLETATTGQERKELVSRWVRAAWHSKFFPAVDKSLLQKFYREEISDKKREYLERLSGERFQQKLKIFYYMHLRQKQMSEGSKKKSTLRKDSRGFPFPHPCP